MKRFIKGALILSLISLFGFGVLAANTYAEEENSEVDTSGTSISLEPSHKTFQISSNSVYEGSFKFKNDGDNELKIEVYVAPYSYVYSEEEDIYKLGFNNENNFTQITRWITIKDESGNYVEHPTFTVPGKESLEIEFRISTPNNIPAGGQYAVIFAQTVGGSVTTSGIRTEASAGMLVYGHSSEGEAVTSAEISNLSIKPGLRDKTNTNQSGYYASAKVKNAGNIDFNAIGKLKVEPIIWGSSYEAPQVVFSIIPESERIVEDEWKDIPAFGLYKVTWTVEAAGQTESIERIIFIMSPVFMIITIILLTFLIIWIIIRVRRRKERRARLAV